MRKLRPTEGEVTQPRVTQMTTGRAKLELKSTGPSNALLTSCTVSHTSPPYPKASTPGGHSRKEKGNPLPSPVGVVPEPGDGGGFQAIHHRIPIVHKGLVQSGRRGRRGRAECRGQTTTTTEQTQLTGDLGRFPISHPRHTTESWV